MLRLLINASMPLYLIFFIFCYLMIVHKHIKAGIEQISIGLAIKSCVLDKNIVIYIHVFIWKNSCNIETNIDVYEIPVMGSVSNYASYYIKKPVYCLCLSKQVHYVFLITPCTWNVVIYLCDIWNWFEIFFFYF